MCRETGLGDRLAREHLVGGVNADIDHGDRLPCTVSAACPRHVSIDERYRLVEHELGDAVRDHLDNARVCVEQELDGLVCFDSEPRDVLVATLNARLAGCSLEGCGHGRRLRFTAETHQQALRARAGAPCRLRRFDVVLRRGLAGPLDVTFVLGQIRVLV